MRARFADGVEIKLLFTRRLVKGLASVAAQLAELGVAGDLTREQRQAVADFTRQSAVADGDYESPYLGGVDHPEFGAQPKLVTRIDFAPDQIGGVDITIRVEGEQELKFQLSLDGVLGLVHLFQERAQSAGWDLPPGGQVTAGRGSGRVN
jgi:hypothetical protein